MEEIFYKDVKKKLLVLFAILFSSIFFVLAEVPTNLEIPNSPPFLIMDIPNQSWPANENNLNAFDLDNHFSDSEGDPISYYSTLIPEISVQIHPSTNEVSFFPLAGFSGIRNITFYASDSMYDTLSNVVILMVGTDVEPPKWFSPSLSKTIIYQNDMVSFFTSWTDNRGLNSYIFSINQGSGWENYSSQNFSGIENVSSQSIQIRAPPLNTVYWKFFGFDDSGNMNVTSVQSFSVSQQALPPSGGGHSPDSEDDENIIDRIIREIENRSKSENFQISVSEFNVSLKQGSSRTQVLKITNIGSTNLSISVFVEKVGDFVVLSDNNFSISLGNFKEITIDFNAPERAIPGQYFGYIIVKSQKITKKIPVIFDIKALDLEFDLKVNLSPESSQVRSGENLTFNISLSNLKDLKETDISLYYAIKDYDGKVYNFFEEPITFFYDLNLERELQVPETTPEGKYLIYARASNDRNIAIDSAFFEVGNRINFYSFFKTSSIFILIALFSLFFATTMVRYKSNQKKGRLLELYIMLNKLKNLVKQKKEEEALQLFIKINELYHKKINPGVYTDKERLKKEINDLFSSFEEKSGEKIHPENIPESESKKEISQNKNNSPSKEIKNTEVKNEKK